MKNCHRINRNFTISNSVGFFILLLLLCILSSCGAVVHVPLSTESVNLVSPTKEDLTVKVPTDILTPESTATNTPELYTLSLLTFHDYNGNGTMDETEPALDGIVNKTSAGECTTDAEGKCDIQELPAGNYKLSIYDNRIVEDFEKMRYLLPSASEVKTIEAGLDINLENDEILSVPLGQGFLTWPSDSSNLGMIGCYMDRVLGPGCVTWNDDPNLCGEDHIWGMDIKYQPSSLMIAVAPSYVEEINYQSSTNITVILGLYLDEKTSNGTRIEYDLDYSHMDEIKLTPQQIAGTEIVKRGDPVGIVNTTIGSYRHLHFGFYRFVRSNDGQAIPLTGESFITVDPYARRGELSFWIVRNLPYPPY